MPNLWTLPSCPGSQEIFTPPIRHVRKLSSDMEHKQVTTTDTPQTDDRLCTISIDAIYVKIDGKDSDCQLIDADFTRQLKRELTQSKAEVERLKANLRRAVEIAEDFLPSGYDGYDETIRTELDQIKATLNPTDK